MAEDGEVLGTDRFVSQLELAQAMAAIQGTDDGPSAVLSMP
jgi:hypothetical protein